MTNLTLLITLFTIFNVSFGFENTCNFIDEVLMLPAPEDVYQKEKTVEIVSNVTVPLSIFVVAPVSETFGNITVPSVLETPKHVVTKISKKDSEEEIHEKSMKIAGFVAQCIVFLFVYTIVTMDIDQFDENEEEEIVVYKLHRASEIQTCPLPTRQNVRLMRCLVESESDC